MLMRHAFEELGAERVSLKTDARNLRSQAAIERIGAKREGVLDITPDVLPDFYLVMTGPPAPAMSSRGRARPWLIESVHLFEARRLIDALTGRRVKIGVATSVVQQLWADAEIYPNPMNTELPLGERQANLLALFSGTPPTEA